MNKLYRLPFFVGSMNNADQSPWMKDIVILFLVVFLSLVDAATLYTVFDRVMYESQALSMLLTVGSAISLNFIPLIIARLIHCYRYHIHGVQLWMILVMAAAFLVLFSATFYLRWETREVSFGGVESSMMNTAGEAAGVAGTDSESREAVAVTILLGILPGITAFINLALGYFREDPIRRRLDTMKYQLSRMRNQRDVLLAARDELDQDWTARLTALDAAQLETTHNAILAAGMNEKTLARYLLAEKLKDADSISALTESPVTD